MITYLYWILIIGLAGGALYFIGGRIDQWKVAFATAGALLFIGWAAYFFYFEQVFVKRWGGVMSITTPEGQMHITSTWKDDNLWVETYDPVTNTCLFKEYSKGNLLQGEVKIENCNPLQNQ